MLLETSKCAAGTVRLTIMSISGALRSSSMLIALISNSCPRNSATLASKSAQPIISIPLNNGASFMYAAEIFPQPRMPIPSFFDILASKVI